MINVDINLRLDQNYRFLKFREQNCKKMKIKIVDHELKGH